MSKPAIGKFIQLCLAQVGDKYVFGAETQTSDPNPEAFDCSELTQWASNHLGVEFPDGSMVQRDYCRAKGTEISVDKAIRTRGALLFRDVSVTGVGHVAISLGRNNLTVEARGSAYGVGRFDASPAARLWTSAATHPGFNYAEIDPVKLAEYWVVFGRYGGRWGRGKTLKSVEKDIRDAEKKHGVAVVLQRKEPVDLDDLRKKSYPSWLAKKGGN